jgi:hypothetical protein
MIYRDDCALQVSVHLYDLLFRIPPRLAGTIEHFYNMCGGHCSLQVLFPSRVPGDKLMARWKGNDGRSVH